MTASRAMRDQRTVDQRFDHPTKSPEARAMNDIREDVEAGMTIAEARTGFPEIEWIDGGLLAAGGDHEIMGRALLQGQSFAELTLWTGTSEVVISAVKPGAPGNDFTIEVTGGGTAGAETVIKTANAFVIDIQPLTSTANQIATAINANANPGVNDGDGYIMAIGGGTGAANAVAAEANLAGGEGEGWECLVTGEEALPANTTGATGVAMTELVCLVTVPALSGLGDARAAGDVAKVEITSDGIRADVSAILA